MSDESRFKDLQIARKFNMYDNEIILLKEEIDKIIKVINNHKEVTTEITNRYNGVIKELNELKNKDGEKVEKPKPIKRNQSKNKAH